MPLSAVSKRAESSDSSLTVTAPRPLPFRLSPAALSAPSAHVAFVPPSSSRDSAQSPPSPAAFAVIRKCGGAHSEGRPLEGAECAAVAGEGVVEEALVVGASEVSVGTSDPADRSLSSLAERSSADTNTCGTCTAGYRSVSIGSRAHSQRHHQQQQQHQHHQQHQHRQRNGGSGGNETSRIVGSAATSPLSTDVDPPTMAAMSLIATAAPFALNAGTWPIARGDGGGFVASSPSLPTRRASYGMGAAPPAAEVVGSTDSLRPHRALSRDGDGGSSSYSPFSSVPPSPLVRLMPPAVPATMHVTMGGTRRRAEEERSGVVSGNGTSPATAALRIERPREGREKGRGRDDSASHVIAGACIGDAQWGVATTTRSLGLAAHRDDVATGGGAPYRSPPPLQDGTGTASFCTPKNSDHLAAVCSGSGPALVGRPHSTSGDGIASSPFAHRYALPKALSTDAEALNVAAAAGYGESSVNTVGGGGGGWATVLSSPSFAHSRDGGGQAQCPSSVASTAVPVPSPRTTVTAGTSGRGIAIVALAGKVNSTASGVPPIVSIGASAAAEEGRAHSRAPHTYSVVSGLTVATPRADLSISLLGTDSTSAATAADAQAGGFSGVTLAGGGIGGGALLPSASIRSIRGEGHVFSSAAPPSISESTFAVVLPANGGGSDGDDSRDSHAFSFSKHSLTRPPPHHEVSSGYNRGYGINPRPDTNRMQGEGIPDTSNNNALLAGLSAIIASSAPLVGSPPASAAVTEGEGGEGGAGVVPEEDTKIEGLAHCTPIGAQQSSSGDLLLSTSAPLLPLGAAVKRLLPPDCESEGDVARVAHNISTEAETHNSSAPPSLSAASPTLPPSSFARGSNPSLFAVSTSAIPPQTVGGIGGRGGTTSSHGLGRMPAASPPPSSDDSKRIFKPVDAEEEGVQWPPLKTNSGNSLLSGDGGGAGSVPFAEITSVSGANNRRAGQVDPASGLVGDSPSKPLVSPPQDVPLYVFPTASAGSATVSSSFLPAAVVGMGMEREGVAMRLGGGRRASPPLGLLTPRSDDSDPCATPQQQAAVPKPLPGFPSPFQHTHCPSPVGPSAGSDGNAVPPPSGSSVAQHSNALLASHGPTGTPHHPALNVSAPGTHPSGGEEGQIGTAAAAISPTSCSFMAPASSGSAAAAPLQAPTSRRPSSPFASSAAALIPLDLAAGGAREGLGRPRGSVGTSAAASGSGSTSINASSAAFAADTRMQPMIASAGTPRPHQQQVMTVTHCSSNSRGVSMPSSPTKSSAQRMPQVSLTGGTAISGSINSSNSNSNSNSNGASISIGSGFSPLLSSPPPQQPQRNNNSCAAPFGLASLGPRRVSSGVLPMPTMTTKSAGGSHDGSGSASLSLGATPPHPLAAAPAPGLPPIPTAPSSHQPAAHQPVGGGGAPPLFPYAAIAAATLRREAPQIAINTNSVGGYASAGDRRVASASPPKGTATGVSVSSGASRACGGPLEFVSPALSCDGVEGAGGAAHSTILPSQNGQSHSYSQQQQQRQEEGRTAALRTPLAHSTPMAAMMPSYVGPDEEVRRMLLLGTGAAVSGGVAGAASGFLSHTPGSASVTPHYLSRGAAGRGMPPLPPSPSPSLGALGAAVGRAPSVFSIPQSHYVVSAPHHRGGSLLGVADSGMGRRHSVASASAGGQSVSGSATPSSQLYFSAAAGSTHNGATPHRQHGADANHGQSAATCTMYSSNVATNTALPAVAAALPAKSTSALVIVGGSSTSPAFGYRCSPSPHHGNGHSHHHHHYPSSHHHNAAAGDGRRRSSAAMTPSSLAAFISSSGNGVGRGTSRARGGGGAVTPHGANNSLSMSFGAMLAGAGGVSSNITTPYSPSLSVCGGAVKWAVSVPFSEESKRSPPPPARRGSGHPSSRTTDTAQQTRHGGTAAHNSNGGAAQSLRPPPLSKSRRRRRSPSSGCPPSHLTAAPGLSLHSHNNNAVGDGDGIASSSSAAFFVGGAADNSGSTPHSHQPYPYASAPLSPAPSPQHPLLLAAAGASGGGGGGGGGAASNQVSRATPLSHNNNSSNNTTADGGATFPTATAGNGMPSKVASFQNFSFGTNVNISFGAASSTEAIAAAAAAAASGGGGAPLPMGFPSAESLTFGTGGMGALGGSPSAAGGSTASALGFGTARAVRLSPSAAHQHLNNAPLRRHGSSTIAMPRSHSHGDAVAAAAGGLSTPRGGGYATAGHHRLSTSDLIPKGRAQLPSGTVFSVLDSMPASHPTYRHASASASSPFLPYTYTPSDYQQPLGGGGGGVASQGPLAFGARSGGGGGGAARALMLPSGSLASLGDAAVRHAANGDQQSTSVGDQSGSDGSAVRAPAAFPYPYPPLAPHHSPHLAAAEGEGHSHPHPLHPFAHAQQHPPPQQQQQALRPTSSPSLSIRPFSKSPSRSEQQLTPFFGIAGAGVGLAGVAPPPAAAVALSTAAAKGYAERTRVGSRAVPLRPAAVTAALSAPAEGARSAAEGGRRISLHHHASAAHSSGNNSNGHPSLPQPPGAFVAVAVAVGGSGSSNHHNMAHFGYVSVDSASQLGTHPEGERGSAAGGNNSSSNNPLVDAVREGAEANGSVASASSSSPAGPPLPLGLGGRQDTAAAPFVGTRGGDGAEGSLPPLSSEGDDHNANTQLGPLLSVPLSGISPPAPPTLRAVEGNSSAITRGGGGETDAAAATEGHGAGHTEGRSGSSDAASAAESAASLRLASAVAKISALEGELAVLRAGDRQPLSATTAAMRALASIARLVGGAMGVTGGTKTATANETEARERGEAGLGILSSASASSKGSSSLNSTARHLSSSGGYFPALPLSPRRLAVEAEADAEEERSQPATTASLPQYPLLLQQNEGTVQTNRCRALSLLSAPALGGPQQQQMPRRCADRGDGGLPPLSPPCFSSAPQRAASDIAHPHPHHHPLHSGYHHHQAYGAGGGAPLLSANSTFALMSPLSSAATLVSPRLNGMPSTCTHSTTINATATPRAVSGGGATAMHANGGVVTSSFGGALSSFVSNFSFATAGGHSGALRPTGAPSGAPPAMEMLSVTALCGACPSSLQPHQRGGGGAFGVGVGGSSSSSARLSAVGSSGGSSGGFSALLGALRGGGGRGGACSVSTSNTNTATTATMPAAAGDADDPFTDGGGPAGHSNNLPHPSAPFPSAPASGDAVNTLLSVGVRHHQQRERELPLPLNAVGVAGQLSLLAAVGRAAVAAAKALRLVEEGVAEGGGTHSPNAMLCDTPHNAALGRRESHQLPPPPPLLSSSPQTVPEEGTVAAIVSPQGRSRREMLLALAATVYRLLVGRAASMLASLAAAARRQALRAIAHERAQYKPQLLSL